MNRRCFLAAAARCPSSAGRPSPARRILVTSGWAAFARSGAVLTYGPRLIESYRRLASYVDRVLKGARPADLPIEQPTVFELIINLRAAEKLGLRVPPTLLVRADEVIE